MIPITRSTRNVIYVLGFLVLLFVGAGEVLAQAPQIPNIPFSALTNHASCPPPPPRPMSLKSTYVARNLNNDYFFKH